MRRAACIVVGVRGGGALRRHDGGHGQARGMVVLVPLQQAAHCSNKDDGQNREECEGEQNFKSTAEEKEIHRKLQV